jgi:hypothetical protein
LSGGTIGPYNGHYDYFRGINPRIDVQHQYKELYNVPLPEEEVVSPLSISILLII